MRRTPLALVLILGVGAACGSDSPAIDSPSSVTQHPDGDGATSTTSALQAVSGASLTSASAPAVGRGLLRAVRVAGHPGFDRMTFEFEGDLPGYEVRYVDGPIVEDGSGHEVQLDGQAFLQIRMEPASGAEIDGEQVREVYSGPKRIRADTAKVTEVVRTGDFEAVLNWVAGVRGSPAAFKVSTLSGPNRLVIDVVSG